MPVKKRPVIERFSHYVYLTESGCWEWRGARNENGYGVIGRGGRGEGNHKAHRVSYQFFNKIELTVEQCVCHKCDTPWCVNPHHLFVGTKKENHEDMRNKGRGRNPPIHIGEKSSHAKLTNKQVIEMRQLAKLGSKIKDLAARYGVERHTVSGIIKRKTWRHI
jgi:hypothetical protein